MRALCALVLAGCWSRSAPPPPVGHSAPPAVVVTSCAIEPLRTRVDLRVVKWLGRAGDRSWLIAEHGRGTGVVLLGFDGGLREVALGDGAPYATHVDGTQLVIAVPRGQKMELRRVDLAPATPAVAVGPTLEASYLRSVALGTTRALADVAGMNVQLQLFDAATGAKIGGVVEIPSTDMEAANLTCTGDRCAALAVSGDGPTRRIFVERFAPDGKHDHEQLADDHIASYKLVRLGARRFAMWTAFDREGISLRELDASGRVLGERVMVTTAKTTDFEVLPDPALPRIAYRNREGWTIAALDPAAKRLGPALATGLPRESYFLLGATLPDGAMLVGFTSTVDYHGGFHSWRGAIYAAFAPTGNAADPSIALASDGGEGRGGIAGFPLVSPGHASVLVLPQGPESSSGGELIELRRPCRPVDRP